MNTFMNSEWCITINCSINFHLNKQSCCEWQYQNILTSNSTAKMPIYNLTLTGGVGTFNHRSLSQVGRVICKKHNYHVCISYTPGIVQSSQGFLHKVKKTHNYHVCIGYTTYIVQASQCSPYKDLDQPKDTTSPTEAGHTLWGNRARDWRLSPGNILT